VSGRSADGSRDEAKGAVRGGRPGLLTRWFDRRRSTHAPATWRRGGRVAMTMPNNRRRSAALAHSSGLAPFLVPESDAAMCRGAVWSLAPSALGRCPRIVIGGRRGAAVDYCARDGLRAYAPNSRSGCRHIAQRPTGGQGGLPGKGPARQATRRRPTPSGSS
jgi:hypothetical protein